MRGAFAGQTFEAFTGKLVKFASVEAARAEIDQIKAALDAAYVAPHPSSVVKAKIRHEIDSLANRGTPSLRAALAHGESVHWKHAPANVKLTEDLATSRVAVTSPDALGLIAWAFRDKLISLLDAEIDAFADDKAALSDEQRDTMIAKLSADLLAAERAEVALVTSAGVDHRADVVDVRALLGIVGREGE
ncbi:hypothetical protein NKH54_22585 [Mesorhizobium sp. M1004]|uniref:hypothetical protein n=1 Tax=Mesorhizobium sp. M1004 TaxID=2957046 RepID=UPI00333C9DAD